MNVAFCMALAIFLFAGYGFFVGPSEAWFGVLCGLWLLAVAAFMTLCWDDPLPVYGVILPIAFSLIDATIPFVGWVATAGAICNVLQADLVGTARESGSSDRPH